MSGSLQNRVNLENLTLAFLILFAAVSSSAISLMQSAYGLALAAWLGVIAWTRGAKGWHHNPLWLPLLALIVANVAAAVFSVEPDRSIKAIKQLALVGMVLMVGNAVGTRRQVKALALTWLGAAGVIGLYAVAQVLFGEDRARGFFGGPMTLVRILTLAIAVAMPLAVYAPGQIRRVVACCLPPAIAALFLTYSRAGWLASGTALLLLAGIKKNKAILTGISLVLCGALLLAAFYPQTRTGGLIRSILQPMNATSARFYKSNLQRYWMYKSALRIFCDYPITGVGQRNFSEVYPDYVPEELRDPRILRDDGRVYTGFAHAHNLYLNLLATQGILGLGAMLWLIGAAIRLTWRNYRRHEDIFLKHLSLGIAIAMAAFLTLGAFDENSRDSESIMQLWFLMGIAVAVHRLTPERNEHL